VIAGHSGYRTGPAVFDDLEALQPGDRIYVVDDAGTTIEFTVRESREYGPYERPEEVFASNEGRHLNLITCTGSWDSAAGTHSKRLVVFADATLPYSEEGSASD
jgi:sortase A